MRVSGTSSPGCGPAAAGTGAAAGFGAAGACVAGAVAAGRRGCWSLRRPTLFDVLQNVVLGDAPARSGTWNLAKIELMFLRNLAHQRRRAQPLAMRCRSFRFGCGSSRGCRRSGSIRSRRRRRSRGSGRLRRTTADHRDHGIDLYCVARFHFDRRKRSACRRRNLRVYLIGRNLKQRLVALDAVTHLLQPLGNRAFEDRLAHLRHHDVRAAAARSHGFHRGCWSRRCLGGFRLFLFLRGLLLWRCGCWGRLAGNCSVAVADHRNHGIDLHCVAGIHFDLGKRAACRRWNFRVYLVGRNLKQRLVALDAVAGLLQPFRDRPLKDRLAHLGHDDVCWHLFVPPSHSCGLLCR